MLLETARRNVNMGGLGDLEKDEHYAQHSTRTESLSKYNDTLKGLD